MNKRAIRFTEMHGKTRVSFLVSVWHTPTRYATSLTIEHTYADGLCGGTEYRTKYYANINTLAEGIRYRLKKHRFHIADFESFKQRLLKVLE